MLAQLRPAIVSFVILTVITGIIYPAVVTGIARVAFPRQAEGSLIELNGKAVGSKLIAQGFTDPKHFWPRPSAASYNGAGGSGSNLGPSNPALLDAVKQRIVALHAADPGNNQPIPVELVTASASGLDPQISQAGAVYQASRVAKAQGLATSDVLNLISRSIDGRTLGVLGEPRVNVLHLNMMLDHLEADKAPVTMLPALETYRERGFLPSSR